MLIFQCLYILYSPDSVSCILFNPDSFRQAVIIPKSFKDRL